MSKLKDIVEILDAKRIPLSSKERIATEKIYPYYGAQGIIDYIDKYIFDGNYILVAEDGNNLKSLKNSIATWASGKFWVNNHAHILGEKNGFNLKYVYYYLNSIDLRGIITGSAQPKLSQDNLANLDIALPNINIQNKIALILSSIDDKIELNNKINSELEAMAKTIYDYWFLQFEFPNEEGKPYKSSGGKMVWNEELKREIPEGWKVKTLENFGKLIMGQSPKSKSYNSNNEGLPLINGAAELQRDKIEITKYTSESTRICTKGDLIFCIRATIGNINYADKSYCLGRGVGAFHVISKEYNEYMFFVLDNILNIYNNTLTGSIIVGITKEDLLQQSMINPPKDIIMNFYNEVHFMIEKINLIKKENQELISLRDFLLPLLMNGQIGFKD